jgi:adenylate kinase
VVSALPQVRHVQASQLLKEALQAQSEELRLGPVQGNQEVLMEAFAKLRAATEDVILLDAHCIVDSANGVIVIPEQVFRSFLPTGFIEVWDEPGAIVSRRTQDTGRARPQRDENAIREHQWLSGETVRQHANEIGVPLVRVKSGDEHEAIVAVRTFGF